MSVLDTEIYPNLAITQGVAVLSRDRDLWRESAGSAKRALIRTRGQLLGGGDPQVNIDCALRIVQEALDRLSQEEQS